jgi:hypothetical protein
MTLSALIRKRDTGNLATAIPAISATQPKGEAATVARIATVAVANPKEGQTAPPAKVGAGDTATASRWLFHFADRELMEVVFAPAVSHANALACYPDTVAAEPQTDRPQRTPTETEAKEITALVLAVFGSDSDVDRNEALAVALANPDGALLCYRTIAEERGITLPAADDDRRCCTQCLNLRGRACIIAKPERGALVVANRGYWPSPDTLQRCAGYLPNTTDDDQRTGRESWPGL